MKRLGLNTMGGTALATFVALSSVAPATAHTAQQSQLTHFELAGFSSVVRTQTPFTPSAILPDGGRIWPHLYYGDSGFVSLQDTPPFTLAQLDLTPRAYNN